MTNSGIFLYPQIRELFSSHQRSLFLQEMGVSRETNQTMCRQWENLVYFVLNGILYQTLLFRSQGSMQKRGQKDCKSQRWKLIPRKLLSRYNRTDTHMNSETVTVPTRRVRIQTRQNPGTENGKQTQSSPLPRNLLALIPSGQGEISFLYWSVS